MSPRRHHRRPEDGGRREAGVPELTEEFAGADYVVRPVSGERATKTYRCPGCDQEVRPGVPHVVAWPADGDAEVDRRHWHRPCWQARERRGAQGRRR